MKMVANRNDLHKLPLHSIEGLSYHRGFHSNNVHSDKRQALYRISLRLVSASDGLKSHLIGPLTVPGILEDSARDCIFKFCL